MFLLSRMTCQGAGCSQMPPRQVASTGWSPLPASSGRVVAWLPVGGCVGLVWRMSPFAVSASCHRKSGAGSSFHGVVRSRRVGASVQRWKQRESNHGRHHSLQRRENRMWYSLPIEHFSFSRVVTAWAAAREGKLPVSIASPTPWPGSSIIRVQTSVHADPGRSPVLGAPLDGRISRPHT